MLKNNKNCELFIKNWKNILISSFFIINGIHGMNSETSSLKDPIEALCNPIKKVDDIFLLMITPDDEKSILMGDKNGIISRHSLDDSYKEQCLIKHSKTHYIPIVAAAKKDNSLIVASAINYIDEKKQKKAECCIWYKECVKKREFEPLQALTINKSGNLLVMASQQQTISCMNLNNDTIISKKIDLKNKFVDIACNADGTMILAASVNYILLMNYISNQLIPVGDPIEIYSNIKYVLFSKPEQIVYITDDNAIKTLDVYALINQNDGIVSTILFKTPSNTQIVIDEYNYPVVALWKKNKHMSGLAQHQIIIKDIEDDNREDLVFDVPIPHEKYEYISKQGILKYSKNRLDHIALYNNIIVAIAIDGKLYWPNIIDQDNGEFIQKNISRDYYKKKSPRLMKLSDGASRSRSSSSETLPRRKRRDSYDISLLGVSSDDEQSSRQNSPKESPELCKKSSKKISGSTGTIDHDIQKTKNQEQIASMAQSTSDLEKK